jgi:hypothetical protein
MAITIWASMERVVFVLYLPKSNCRHCNQNERIVSEKLFRTVEIGIVGIGIVGIGIVGIAIKMKELSWKNFLGLSKLTLSALALLALSALQSK